MNRRRAREVAMQALYVLDQDPRCDREFVDHFVAERLRFPGLESFALGLVRGVRAHLAEIDVALTEAAENWSVGRMPPVDRNILRLAAYELLIDRDTPHKVVIDEAIEICKRFSTADGPAFVNGILDRIAHPAAGSGAQQPLQNATPAPTGNGATDADPVTP